MNFMFLAVPPNAQSYLQEKLLDDPTNKEEQDKITRLIDNSRTNTVIPEMVAESEFYDLDRRQMKLVDIAKRPRALAEKREQLGDPEDTFLGVIDGLVNF